MCRYFHWVCHVQAVLLEWKEKFMQQECNYDEIFIYTSQQSQLKRLGQTFFVSSAIVDAQAVKNTFLNVFEQLNVLLIKYIPGQPDAKWCTLPSLLHDHGVALPPHLLNLISEHVLFPGEERVEELLDSPLSPDISGIFQPGHDISLKLTKTLSLQELSNLVERLKKFLQPIMDVLDILVFFKLHPSKMFDQYLQAYLNKEREPREQHTTTTFSSTAPSTRMMEDQNKVEGVPLRLLQKAVVHTQEMIMQLMQGTAVYSEIVAEGELSLENLNIEQEFIILSSFSEYSKLPLVNYEVLASVQNMLELFQYVHHIRNIHTVCEQYQQQGFKGDPKLIKLCQCQAQSVLLEWKKTFMEQKTNYDEILAIVNQQFLLENLSQTIWAYFDIENMDILPVKNIFLYAFQQLNDVLSKYIPGQPAIKWCTLPFFLQSWGVALPPQLLDLISQHILFSEEERVEELLESPLSPNIMSTFQPGHAILTKALSLHELSVLVEEMKKFLQSMLELMQELPQYVHYIQVIHRICEQYQLQGCLKDPQFVELCQLAEDLNIEANHAKMTLVEASKKTEIVKEVLCLSSEASPHYLELFTAVGDSNAFYQFVRDKQFVGEKGRALFQQQYQLITAQLQHDEYDETVLNHLCAAFKFICPFMDTYQNFHQLMSHVTSLNVTNEMKHLETVNSNITLIQLWFSRTEVSEGGVVCAQCYICTVTNVEIIMLDVLTYFLFFSSYSTRETHWRM